MVESQKTLKNIKPQKFDKYIIITIRNEKYGNRKKQVKKREKINDKWADVLQYDENNQPILKVINIDLPYTLKDEIEFKRLLENFKLKEEDTTRFYLQETTCDEINEVLNKTYDITKQNFKQGKRTFIIFFYAGHGAMRYNQQVLVLNGVEKKMKDPQTREEKLAWDYVFEIERRFKYRFAYFGRWCFIWATFACCRSIHKDIEAVVCEPEPSVPQNQSEDELSELEDSDEKEQKEEKENKKKTRGTGARSMELNFIFVNGCQANTVMADDNPLIEKICQEFRLNQKNKKIRFPQSIKGLVKRFPGCLIQNAVSLVPKIPYQDKELVKIKFDPDHVDIEQPKKTEISNEPPEGFNEASKLSFETFKEVEDGWYWGTIVNDLPHGYGRLLYKPNVNHHPKIDDKNASSYIKQKNLNDQNYVYYEGDFKYGCLDGNGTLKLNNSYKKHDSDKKEWVTTVVPRVLIGQFMKNEFHGSGMEINNDKNGHAYVCVGEYQHGQPHGNATKRFEKLQGQIEQGTYLEGQITGPCLVITPITKTSFYGMKKNDLKEGLGVRMIRDEEYCGLWEGDIPKGIGKHIYKSGVVYKGQICSLGQTGYGEEHYTDKSHYKGFFHISEKQGIGILTDKTGNVKYQVYDKNEHVCDLSVDEVKLVNSGQKTIKEMEKFYKDEHLRKSLYYTQDDALTFRWIRFQGHRIIMLVNDLEYFAQKNKMFGHQLEDRIKNQLNDLESQKREILAKLEEKELNFQKYKEEIDGRQKINFEEEYLKIKNDNLKLQQERDQAISERDQLIYNQNMMQQSHNKTTHDLFKQIEDLKQSLANSAILMAWGGGMPTIIQQQQAYQPLRQQYVQPQQPTYPQYSQQQQQQPMQYQNYGQPCPQQQQQQPYVQSQPQQQYYPNPQQQYRQY